MQERGISRAAQQSIQFVQLATLALPADPAAFAGIPEAAPMEYEEPTFANAHRVNEIEPLDTSRRSVQQRIVARRMLSIGITPVRQQREVHRAFADR